MSKAKTAPVMAAIRQLFTRGNRQAGITISEVLITIALVGVVASIALPIVNNIVAQTQIDAAKQDLTRTAGALRNAMGVPDQTTVNIPSRIIHGQTYQFSNIVEITPGVDQRIVMTGKGTEAEPYTSFCVTAYVADQDFQFKYGDKEVTSGSCNLPSGSVTPPSAPLNPVASNESATSVSVAFDTPASNGGSPITGFNVLCTSTDGGAAGSASGPAGVSSLLVDSLTTGKTYTCKVNAANDSGAGDWSEPSNAVIVYTAPAAPTAVSVERRWTGAAVVSFDAPTDNGGSVITSYTVTCKSSNGGVDASNTGDNSPITITGLTMGSDYTCSVKAQNAAGLGDASVPSEPFLAAMKPEAPTATEITVAGLTSVSVAFTPSAVEAGEPTTSYQATCEKAFSNETHTATGSSSPLTVSGLTNGARYSCTVTATNVLGTSDPSNALATEVASAPSAPTDVLADRGASDGVDEITVQWTASDSNGSAVTSYEIVATPTTGGSVSTTVNGNVTSGTLSGLLPGKTYSIKVRALNAVGASTWANAADTYLTPSKPATISAVNLSAGSSTASSTTTSVTATWNAPADNGDNITDYVVEYKKHSTNVWTVFSHSPSSAETITITGLEKGIQYDVRIAAVNGVAQADWSSPASLTTNASAPTAPLNVDAIANTALASSPTASVYLRWDAPAHDGGATVTGYIVDYKKSSDLTWTTFNSNVADLEITVTDLDKAVGYDFRVTAFNNVGVGAASATDSVTTSGSAPNAPANLVAIADAGTVGSTTTSASLTWYAPVNGGLAISDYVIEYKATGATQWVLVNDGVSTNTSATVTGLQKGNSYDFRVAAVNSLGNSAWSDAATLTTQVTDPSEPLNLTAVPNTSNAKTLTASVYLSWEAPADLGGSSLSSYVVEYKKSIDTDWTVFSSNVTTLSSTVTGLQKATLYDFRVKTVNLASASSTYSTSGATTSGTAPAAPSGVNAIAGTAAAGSTTTSVNLTWTAPDNGGSAITDYIVQYKASAATDWVTVEDGTSTSTSATVSGLQKASNYDFRVAAVNSIGTGPYSNEDSATTTIVTSMSAPDPVTSLTLVAGTATTGATTSISATWVAPADNGGAAILDYVIQYKKSSTGTWNTFNDGLSTTASATITGLDKGTTYDVRVAAVNSVDTGAYASAATTTGAAAPTAPQSLTAAANTGTSSSTTVDMTLSWTAPADNGGSAITGYKVYNGTTLVDTVTSSPYTVTGLSKGTSYTFSVKAVNGAGTSAEATVTKTTSTTAPSAPVLANPTMAATSASLSWTAPADNGGDALGQYSIKYRATGSNLWVDGGTALSTATTASVTGLQKNVSYDFKVVATNTNGSTDSNTVVGSTLKTAPGAVTSLTAAANAGTASVATVGVYLSWTAPADNGGEAITDYSIQYRLTGAGTWTTFADGTSTTTNTTVTGLTKGTSYDFQVAAVNSATGAYTSVTKTTAITAPAAPVVTVGTIASTSVPLSWTAPNDGGAAITGYAVKYRATGATVWVTAGSTTSLTYTVGSLEKGTAYEFQVEAGNSVGVTASATVSATTLTTVPGAPATLTATPATASELNSTTSVSLSWTAPTDNGGTTITGYEVYVGATLVTTTSGSTTSYSVTGLNKGTTYGFTVAAKNAKGTGTGKTASATTDTSKPGAPTITSSSASSSVGSLTSGSITINWSAPADDGGTAITNYRVFVDGTVIDSGIASTTRTYTVTGLTKGQSYTVTVYAVNSNGTGSQGGSATKTPPVTAPSSFTASNSGQVFNAVAIAGYNTAYFSGSSPATWSIINGGGYMRRNSGTIDLAWTSPADTGGAGQTVTYSVSGPSGTVLQGSTATSITNTAVPDANTTYTWTVTACNTAGLCTTSSTSKAIPAGPATVTLNSANPMNWTFTSNGLSGTGAAFYRWNGSTACSGAHVSSERMGFSTMPANNNWSMNTNGYASPYYRVLVETGSYLSVVTGCKLG